MPRKKKSSCHGRRSSNENKRSGAGETTESGVLDSNHGVYSELGEDILLYFSKAVVSLALYDGHEVLFVSCGIAIYHSDGVAKFLTSTSLVRALDNEALYHDDIKIQVHHGGHVVTGCLDEYDLDYEIAVVKSTSFPDVRTVSLHDESKFELGCDVLAIGRDTYGRLITTKGKLTSRPSRFEDSEYLMFSTCELSKAWDGGPLFDLHRNFVGMNLFSRMKKSLFVPVSLIIERLAHFRTSQEKTVFLNYVEDLKSLRVADEDLCSHPEGYNCFGDVYPTGVWRQFDRRVIRKISRNVVSLASFSGNTEFFSCTGFFIDWDKCQDESVSTILTSATLVIISDPTALEHNIFDGLRIEVLLPEGQRTEGTLMHYNLHYNVALVGVKNYVAASPAILKHEREFSKLAAVGRGFQSGNLMASGGKLVGWSGSLDCKILRYSTCKVTTAGIGGPLVDNGGNFIGMNFYDPKMGTPVLLCDDILRVLECFKETGNSSCGRNEDNTVGMSRWPVPDPFYDNGRYFNEYELRVLASGCKYKYRFGFLHVCK